jgi:DNA polymerase-3 subunit alpha (Gram-positive type)
MQSEYIGGIVCKMEISMYDTYVSIDLETTGLNPKRDRIIEIGAIRVEQGQIVEEFSTFVDPGRKLEERITELTGIRDEDLADAPQLDEVFPKLLEFMGELPLLGHSILFDYSFLKKAAVDRKITFERSAVDTLQIARKYLQELPHRNLGYLCQYYEIPHHAHRALEDAKATDRLFRKLAELFYQEETGGQASTESVEKKANNNLFEPQPLHFQVKRDTPATKPQKERLYRLAEQHKITLEVDVALIGLFQKLGYDPLGLLKGYVVGDWEYTHMLSTLGNNNWLSGYYSVMLPLSLSLFCKAAEEGRRAASILLGGGNVLVVMMLFLQGSDGGVMVACVTLWICFWSSRKKNGLWEPLLVLLSGACVGMLLWGKVMQSRGTYDILLQDGIARKMAVWQGWFLLAVVCLLFCGIHYALPEKKKRALQIGALCGSLLLAAGVIIWYILKLQGSDFAEWGNRRGMLWQMAWQGFCRGDLKQKLLGVGPDCFAAYLEQVLPGGTVLFDKGYFADSIFTNAHNEWLTTLINLGALGTTAYAAVFLTALRKYRRNSMAIMLLFTYGMHSLISFQQVLNTPFFFLLLGVCEAEQRMNQQYNTDTHEESIEVG